MILIKHAETTSEFEKIHALNYKTFVEEIPQHDSNRDQSLKDRFHHLNQYLIAVLAEEIVAMVCYNTERPFSLDQKGVDLDLYISKEDQIAEVRLLSIQPKWRKGILIRKLLGTLIKELLAKNISLVFVSANAKELSFYHKIGFTSFGKKVGKQEAWYQPMYIRPEALNPLLNSE